MSSISVIIPTLNAEGLLPDVLRCLIAQSKQPAELIIVDSSSADATVELANAYGCVTFTVPRQDFDHGGTRNLGAKQAKGDILVFMTQDALPVDTDALANLVAPLSEESIAAIYGRHMPRNDASPIDRFARLFNYPPEKQIKGRDDLSKLGIKALFFSDVFSAVRKRDFEAVGGFPDEIITGEDMVLASRLIMNGWQVAYVPEAAVWHSHNYSPWRQLQRYFDIGASHAALSWLRELAPAEREGQRFVRELFRYLAKERLYGWFPAALADIGARWLGYRLGLASDRLPVNMKWFLGMNKAYWRRQAKLPR